MYLNLTNHPVKDCLYALHIPTIPQHEEGSSEKPNVRASAFQH